MSIGYSQMPTWLTTNSSIPQKTGSERNNVQNNSNTTEKITKSSTNRLSQSASGLMREVFSADSTDNIANSSNNGETKTDKKNKLGLPAVVEMDNIQVRTNNRSDKEVILELSQKTGKSTIQVESELKRKYNNGGTTLNLKA